MSDVEQVYLRALALAYSQKNRQTWMNTYVYASHLPEREKEQKWKDIDFSVDSLRGNPEGAFKFTSTLQLAELTSFILWTKTQT